MASTSRNPTLHDVARLAGVSHQTVSRVINGFEGIRPETHARVSEAIAQLGYRRNMAARTLVTGRSLAIGVIAPDTPNIGPLSSLYAIQRAGASEGFHPLITIASADLASVSSAVDFLLERSVDAIVVMAEHAEIVDVVESLVGGVPTMYLLTGEVHVSRSVGVDQELGVRLAMDHLRDLGHTAIQHVAGPTTFTEAALREKAFLRYVAEHDLEELPMLRGEWTAADGFLAGEQVDAHATAVFCANDQMAEGLVHALAVSGRRVPEDVSVVGFDNTPESAYFRPALTTVNQDFAQVGERAVSVLLALLRGEDAPTHSPLAPTLEVRSSTAPPRAVMSPESE